MSWQMVGEIIVVIWFFFHWPIIILTVYWIVFREWPFPRGYKWSSDLKMLNGFCKQVFYSLRNTPNKGGGDRDNYYSEGDYYDDYDGTGADAGPTVRHPKNRDRAYQGGA